MQSYILILKLLALVLVMFTNFGHGLKTYNRNEMLKLREEVKEMFYHAYNSYLKYAYPYDELRPISCDGVDTYGSYSLTLIDALDTLAIMGNYTEFQRVVNILTTKENFDANINVSVFETNIRIIGGLLSAHLLSNKAGVELEPGWPCNGPLLRLAEDVAKRLIVAFDTATGMPYGTINLRHGVPKGETTVTCTAGIGTFIVEFGTLSRLTGDPLYEEVAMNALYSLFNHRSQIGLFGNHIDVATGRWTAQDAGIGSGIDSYFEYLVKGAILLQRPELMEMFYESRKGIDKYLKRDDWYLWVSMTKGQVTLPVFQSLEAYWPGVLSLIGETSSAMKTLHNYHQVWLQYGFTPEFYNIPQTEAGTNRENYPLRPELIESVMYLYRSTGDPYLLQIGVDILRSIQHSAKTPCGYATIKDVRDHRKEDRMESFFLAETTKYLYLLFDPNNFIHNQGQHGTVINTPNGECIIDAGGYIFNTEAHPVDPSALHCCYDVPKQNLFDFSQLNAMKNVFRGDSIDKVKTLQKKHQRVSKAEKEFLQKSMERESSESYLNTSPDLNVNGISADGKDVDIKMRDVNLQEPNIRESHIREGNIREGNIREGNIRDGNIREGNIREGNIREGNIRKGNIREGNTQESNIRDSNIREVNIRDVHEGNVRDIRDANINTNIREASIREAKIREINKQKQNINSPVNSQKENAQEMTSPDGSLDKMYHPNDEDTEMDDITIDDDNSNDDVLSQITTESTMKLDDNDSYNMRNNGGQEGEMKEIADLNLTTDGDSDFETDKESENVTLPHPPVNQTSFNKFNPQAMLERIRLRNKSPQNKTWEYNYKLLSCKAQPFIQKMSIFGEFFNR